MIKRLLQAGVTVQRYDAYSTDSIYLKLDYGVCNSIRIGGHPGKGYLKYRYNIGGYIKKFKEKNNMVFYPSDKSKNLVRRILKDREIKIQRYGKEQYRHYMKKNLDENKNHKGFWKQARLITDFGGNE